MFPRFLVFVVVILMLGVCQEGACGDEKPVMGYVEKVLLSPGKIQAYALLNSGVAASVIYSPQIEEIEREKRKWVRYTIETRFGQKTTFESPVVKSRLGEEKYAAQQILTIRVQLCLGESLLDGNFDLVPSSSFTEQLVLGRDLLAGHMLIDPNSSYVLEPRCT